ncbi:MAG: hypothetical protein PHU25_13545 [Deltaproteobacteria bacterium]|nr:hypothetical protein [Deltaproteobacteria bacterium]
MTRPSILVAAVAAALLLLCAAPVLALVHVARAGETLEKLALRYYGQPDKAIVIRAANGFVHPDDGSLTQGERVEVPEVTYHRLRAGDTWQTLADRYLGSPLRGAFLAEMNGAGEAGLMPAPGAVVKIPYQLLHVMAGDETLNSVARMYFGATHTPAWLKSYNLTRKRTFKRGEALLVPLMDVELTDEARASLDGEREDRASPDDQKAQLAAVAGIGMLKDHFVKGRYVEMVALAEKLLVPGKITEAQKLGVFQYQAFAYVALGERALALEAFRKALGLQPDMDLSPITISPKILKVFREAKNGMAGAVQKPKVPPKKP